MFNLVELFNYCNNVIVYEEAEGKVNYAFLESDDALYIFFQPSRGREDWRANFAYWRKPYKDMSIKYRVHGGFLKCWKTIEDTVINKVTEKDAVGDFRWKRIVTVGYSHGAALAALCHEAVWFHREDLRAEGLDGIGFDGPRVYAGLKVKKKLKERWARFTMYRNGSDIVTHLPPSCFFFAHVGGLKQIGKRNIFKCVKHHYPDEIRKSLAVVVESENTRV